MHIECMDYSNDRKDYNMSKTDKILYQCIECGLHYHDEQTAKQCEAYCKKYHGCSMAITKLSVERSKTDNKPQP